MIQQNSAASEEMASTAEELSSQAEVLQSAIAFFKTGEKQAARVPQSRKECAGPPLRAAPQAGRCRAPLQPRWAKLQRAVHPSGTSIDLDSNNGSADARDRDFTAYEA